MPIRERLKRLFKNASFIPHRNTTEADKKKKAEKTRRQNSRTASATARGIAPPGGPNGAAAAAKARFAGAQPRMPKLGRDGKPKIELYRAHEVPPSKYRGPFDPVHMKKLSEYSIRTASRDRPLSVVSQLSPTDDLAAAAASGHNQEDGTRFFAPYEETLDERIQSGRRHARRMAMPMPSTSPDCESDFTFLTHDGTETVSSGTLFTSYTEDASLHRFESQHSRKISSPLSGYTSYRD
jgi:hypothetical protein